MLMTDPWPLSSLGYPSFKISTMDYQFESLGEILFGATVDLVTQISPLLLSGRIHLWSGAGMGSRLVFVNSCIGVCNGNNFLWNYLPYPIAPLSIWANNHFFDGRNRGYLPIHFFFHRGNLCVCGVPTSEICLLNCTNGTTYAACFWFFSHYIILVSLWFAVDAVECITGTLHLTISGTRISIAKRCGHKA